MGDAALPHAPLFSVGSGSIDCSKVEDLPQFKHSAAVSPSAPDKSRNAMPPQCGHMNFMVALSGPQGDALISRWGCVGTPACGGRKASMSAPRKRQPGLRLHCSRLPIANLVRIRTKLAAEGKRDCGN
jgi:hypothetical protein